MKKRSSGLLMKALSIGIGLLASQAMAQSYIWKNVTVPAGGYVSGIDYSLVSQGLVYARTDMGGAYRWDNVNNVWVPLTDMFSDWNLYGIESIAPDPKNANVVYAAIGQNYNGTNGFILSSTNQGNTWTQNNIGVVMGGNADGRNAGERLAVDPNLTSKLYFASRSGGLWLSTNSAATWAKVGAFPVNGDAGYGLSYVIFDPHGTVGTASATIYVGVETMASGNSNLYRSINSGASWTLVPGGPTNMITPHASLGSDGNLWINYASGGYGPGGMTNGQVWKLNTATLTWTNVTPAGGPPNGSGGYGGISVDAQNAQHVVVTTLDWYAANDKIFSTANAGGSWTTIGNVTTGWNAGPFANYDNNGAIWTRFCTTYDGGAGWAGDIKIDPFNSNNAIYTTGGGVWSSTNINAATQPAGVTWTFTDYGLEETAIQDMTSSVAGGVMFSAMGDIDGMRHTDVTQSPALGMYCNPSWNTTNGIDFAEQYPQTVVRVGDGLWVATAAGGYSTNNGQTWTAFPTNPAGIQQYSSNGQISINSTGTTILWSLPNNPPAYSSNFGASWINSTGLPTGAQIGSDRMNAGIFYGVSGNNLYVSTNGGASFTVAGTFAGGISWANRPRAVFGIAGEVWVPTSSGLYRYTNVGLGAVTTTQIANISNAVAVGFGKAAPGYTHPAVYLVGTVNGTYGFYRCDDGVGTTWVRVNDANHQFGGPSFTAGDETIYGRMYLGTNGRGILYGDITVAIPTNTPTNTSTNTATSTSTKTPTFTPTSTQTMSPTSTPTKTPTVTATLTPTLTTTNTSTYTAAITSTFTNTDTNTGTRTSTPTSTNTETFTASPTNTSTRTLTATVTNTPTNTPLITSTFTLTGTNTSTASPSLTPTLTFTPTLTYTSSSTNSPTSTSTNTSTKTSTNTFTATSTDTMQFSPTDTFSPTITFTPTDSMTPTASLTATSSATPTITLTPTNSATGTFTRTPTPTATTTFTSTFTLSPTSTGTSTNTFTSTSTATQTYTGTDTFTWTNTPTFTWTSTPTPTQVTVLGSQGPSAPPTTLVELSGASGVTIAEPEFTNPSAGPVTMTSLAVTETNNLFLNITSLVLEKNGVIITTATIAGNIATFNFNDVIPAHGSVVYDILTGFTSTAAGTFYAGLGGTSGTNGQAVAFNNTIPNLQAIISQATPTPTFSPTSTQSPTETPSLTPVPVSIPVVYPNPADGTEPVRLRPPAYLGVSDVKVRLFTLAFRKVQENTYSQVPAGTDVPISLTDKWGKPLASGLYYVVVNTTQGRSIAKFLIIR